MNVEGIQSKITKEEQKQLSLRQLGAAIHPFRYDQKIKSLKNLSGLPWWSSGYHSMLPMQGGPGSIPVQGTSSHRPQVRVGMSQLMILSATTKTQHSQINRLTRGGGVKRTCRRQLVWESPNPMPFRACQVITEQGSTWNSQQLKKDRLIQPLWKTMCSSTSAEQLYSWLHAQQKCIPVCTNMHDKCVQECAQAARFITVKIWKGYRCLPTAE